MKELVRTYLEWLSKTENAYEARKNPVRFELANGNSVYTNTVFFNTIDIGNEIDGYRSVSLGFGSYVHEGKDYSNVDYAMLQIFGEV